MVGQGEMVRARMEEWGERVFEGRRQRVIPIGPIRMDDGRSEGAREGAR